MASSPVSCSHVPIPTVIDTSVANFRKVVKRRKLDVALANNTSSSLYFPSVPSPQNEPVQKDLTHLEAGSIPATCVSCRRAIARSGNAPGGANVVVCARCRALTCVICSRKCEGSTASLSATSSSYVTKPVSIHVPTADMTAYKSRKGLPMRRLPLRVNVATANQESTHGHQAATSTLSSPSHGPIWPMKHVFGNIAADGMYVETPSNEAWRCAYGIDANFCKACVREDISSGSIVCLGCTVHLEA